MKRFILLIMLIAIPAMAQNFVDIPAYMPQDTLFTRTRCVRDFYFNSNNDSTSIMRYAGPVDWSILGSVAANTDTAIVEAYGITRKLLTGTTNYRTEYIDSTRVASVPLTTALTLNTYAIDELFTSFLIYDGLRIVIKKNGTDADNDTFYHGLRIWPQGGLR